MHRPRPTALVGAFAAVLLALAGCSSTNEETAPEGDATGPAQESAAEFPVTVDHIYGSTTIPAKPERVVTIGWITHDVVAALGIAPVGVPESWGGDAEGFNPWFRTQIEDVLNAPMPEVLAFDDDGPDYEQILALQPDVILAPHSGITDVQYERLSEIAPTVAFAERAWTSGSWDELTGVIGHALGEDEAADELIAQTQTLIEDSAAEYPNLEGTSVLYGLSLAEGSADSGFYISEDPRVALLREFGLVDSPSLSDAVGDVAAGDWFGGVSLEELDTIDTDLFVAWSNSAEETQYTLDHPVFSRWEPISEGRYYFIEDTTLGMATNGPSVLSIPWAIDNGFLEELSSAIDGEGVVRAAP